MDFKTDCLNEVLIRNCFVFVVIEIIKHFFQLSISNGKPPVIKIEFKFIFVDALVIVLVEVSERLISRFPLQSNFFNEMI